jgi:hypothetical protein
MLPRCGSTTDDGVPVDKLRKDGNQMNLYLKEMKTKS